MNHTLTTVARVRPRLQRALDYSLADLCRDVVAAWLRWRGLESR